MRTGRVCPDPWWARGLRKRLIERGAHAAEASVPSVAPPRGVSFEITAPDRRQVMSLGRLRAIFGITIKNIADVQTRAQAMYDGLSADTKTYANPMLPLPAFQGLIQDLGTAHQA